MCHFEEEEDCSPWAFWLENFFFKWSIIVFTIFSFNVKLGLFFATSTTRVSKILNTFLWFWRFHLSFGSKPDIETLHDFEDSEIDAGSSSDVAEVSSSTVNYLGWFCRRCQLSSTYPHWGFAGTAGSGAQPQRSALGPPLLALASVFGLQPPRRQTTAKHALKSRACAPLSNSRETKGHAARSCHPLPDSLPSSTSFSSPLCPLPDHQSQSLSTPHLLRRQCRAAICHPGTRRCHPAGRLPYTAVMASGSPRKISNRQKGRRAGWRGRAEGQRAEDPLSYPSCPRLAAVRPSSPPFASPRFGRSLCTILQWINESF